MSLTYIKAAFFLPVENKFMKVNNYYNGVKTIILTNIQIRRHYSNEYVDISHIFP